MFESGFFVAKPAWHGLGKLIDENHRLSVKEAIAAADMDWEVGLLDLEIAGSEEAKTLGLNGRPVNHKVTYRKTDNSILGVVGPSYHPFQNWELFSWFQPFLDSNEAEFHTAGSLKNGRVVWALAKINRQPTEVAKDDLVEKFLLLSNSHDGTHAIRVGFTPIRVVCANTLAAAFSNSDSKLIKARHTSGVNASLDAIRDTINLIDAKFEATAEQYKFLATRNFSNVDLKKYVDLVWKFGRAQKEDDGVSTRAGNQMAKIYELIDAGLGNEPPAIHGTWWAAYNGVTEYLSYVAGARKAENRLNSLWFGPNARRNEFALNAALTLAS
jgi:phage/plasmid-like protein (TIGR03299 family)